MKKLVFIFSILFLLQNAWGMELSCVKTDDEILACNYKDEYVYFIVSPAMRDTKEMQLQCVEKEKYLQCENYHLIPVHKTRQIKLRWEVAR